VSNTAPILALLTDGRPALLDVLDRIAAHPHRAIQVDTPVVSLEELTEPDTEGFLALVSDASRLAPAGDRPTHFRQGGRDYFFTHVVDRRRRITLDTPPNRFVRRVLEQFRDALAAMDDADEAVGMAKRRVQALLGHTFLADIPRSTKVSGEHVVLHKDPHYRRVMEASVALARLRTQASTPQKARA